MKGLRGGPAPLTLGSLGRPECNGSPFGPATATNSFGMPDTIQTAAIAAGAVVAGAIITAVASSYSARQKIAELELAHQQKLRTDYLSNARLYTQGLYVPLSITLSHLSDSYRAFRNKVDLVVESAPQDAEDAFRSACRQYLSDMQGYFNRGASAFLTIEIEERLLAFNAFLLESLNVTRAVTKFIVEYGFEVGFIPFGRRSFQLARHVQVPTRRVRLLPRGIISAGLGTVGFSYRTSETLAAPIVSRDFEERIVHDLTSLKALIKEVTLGAHVPR